MTSGQGTLIYDPAIKPRTPMEPASNFIQGEIQLDGMWAHVTDGDQKRMSFPMNVVWRIEWTEVAPERKATPIMEMH